MKTNRDRILALVTMGMIAISGGFVSARAEDKPSPCPQKRSRATSNDLVRRAQKKLKDQGYYGGKEDGTLQPETGAALRNYQLAKGLRADGRLNDQTAQSLQLVLLATSPRRVRSP